MLNVYYYLIKYGITISWYTIDFIRYITTPKKDDKKDDKKDCVWLLVEEDDNDIDLVPLLKL
jgi:hypothetical protein